MSPSDNDPGLALAVSAELLYLANLLLLPGLAFLILLWLWYKHHLDTTSLARCHLKQTISASIWAGVLLVLANGAIILFGGYRQPSTWVIVIIYFIVFHSTLVLLGVLGLAKAMAGKLCVYPLIGRRCDE